MSTVFLKCFKNPSLVLHFFVWKIYFHQKYSTMMFFTSLLSAPGPAFTFLWVVNPVLSAFLTNWPCLFRFLKCSIYSNTNYVNAILSFTLGLKHRILARILFFISSTDYYKKVNFRIMILFSIVHDWTMHSSDGSWLLGKFIVKGIRIHYTHMKLSKSKWIDKTINFQ